MHSSLCYRMILIKSLSLQRIQQSAWFCLPYAWQPHDH
jgi:hypothetical protein